MFAVALTAKVNDAGWPAAIDVVGAVMVMPVRGFSETATVAVFPATFAVTVDFAVAVSVTLATPLESVFALGADSVPTSAEKLTGTLVMGCPVTLSTRAEITDVPPDAPSVCGVAERTT